MRGGASTGGNRSCGLTDGTDGGRSAIPYGHRLRRATHVQNYVQVHVGDEKSRKLGRTVRRHSPAIKAEVENRTG
eukprot:SAG22_NODE_74_length_22289_cov_65.265119_23_plen_75_part_00